MRLLVIDHHDSYSHLLHHLFWSLIGTEPRFVAAEPEILRAVEDAEFDAAILSPGPGHPSQVSDFGATLDFLRRFPGKPMLGICLGHQGMAYACGAEIIRLAKPWHGKQSVIHHDGTGLFAGLPQGFAAVRYHSLAVNESRLPRHLRVTARAEDDGSVQGLSFTDRPWHGLQFHPESIGTALGPDLARSFLRQVGGAISLLHLSPSLSASASAMPAPTPVAVPVSTSAHPPASVLLPTLVSPTPLFKALRSLALERRWAHFWLDPQSTQSLETMSSIPKKWATTLMGLARHALELYPWGLALVDCASQKRLETWEGNPLQGLEALRKYRAGDAFGNPAFAAYLSPLDWVGHLHYELGALCQDSFAGWREGLPPNQCLGCFLLPDCLLVLDAHESKKPEWRLHLAAKGMGAPDVEAIDADSLWQDILSRLSEDSVSAGKTHVTLPLPATSLSRQAYAQAFSRIQEALHAGDTYEACLTFTCSVTTATKGSTVPVGPAKSKETETQQTEAQPTNVQETDTACVAYLALRGVNPAPFGAFLATPKATLLSATPELFLSARPHREGMQVASRPIKGTRARGADPTADAAQKNDLGGSAKDRAENLMITDLVRNDLARICKPGSVQVTSLQKVEAHPRVFQMVSEVAGILRPGLGLAACLHATFPGGSMTGAPKLRTMQLLHELEGRPRGAYSGALGTLSRDGSFTLAMVIRTWVAEGHTYSAGCGGAIVTDSKEESEWQEALLKIDVLRQTLGITP